MLVYYDFWHLILVTLVLIVTLNLVYAVCSQRNMPSMLACFRGTANLLNAF